MRFFDPTGIETSQLTKADVVRSSIRGVPESGHAALVGAFTKTGAAKFCALTRQLARRGSRLHQPQHLAFEVAGRIYAKEATRLLKRYLRPPPLPTTRTTATN